MKKFMCIILAAVMALSVFTACGAPADDGVTRVAIVQQLDHSSLDEIRAAIEVAPNYQPGHPELIDCADFTDAVMKSAADAKAVLAKDAEIAAEFNK